MVKREGGGLPIRQYPLATRPNNPPLANGTRWILKSWEQRGDTKFGICFSRLHHRLFPPGRRRRSVEASVGGGDSHPNPVFFTLHFYAIFSRSRDPPSLLHPAPLWDFIPVPRLLLLLVPGRWVSSKPRERERVPLIVLINNAPIIRTKRKERRSY